MKELEKYVVVYTSDNSVRHEDSFYFKSEAIKLAKEKEKTGKKARIYKKITKYELIV